MSLGKLLTAAQAAEALQFPTVRAFYAWVDRHHVTKLHRGRRLMFRESDLEAALERDQGDVVTLAVGLLEKRRGA